MSAGQQLALYREHLLAAKAKGVAWTWGLDQLAICRAWPQADGFVRSDAGVVHVVPWSPAQHMCLLVPWVKSQSSFAALRALLRFESVAVRRLIASHARHFEGAAVSALMGDATSVAIAAGNRALPDSHLPALKSWAIEHVRAREQGSVDWSSVLLTLVAAYRRGHETSPPEFEEIYGRAPDSARAAYVGEFRLLGQYAFTFQRPAGGEQRCGLVRTP